MKINSNWRDVVETINGSAVVVGLNAGEGLGMKYSNAVLGPQKWEGAACWGAGNCTVVVNSWDENTSLIELYPASEPANMEALRTWERLQALLSNTGAAQVGASLPPIEDPTDLRMWEIIKADPSITDPALAQKMGNMDRQNTNRRRKTLEKMGYPVRVPKPTKKKVSRQKA